ncbi:uncharacterized protein LOC132945687 [Metopolophium dirhodum]|uniref:uncharacterized protein LOC132945687 n=1 Tax=Metopolophium dirhodum TaxID=44670 RepID=UPI00298F7F83|nr:uncharacterized protein LOC132945687 [Metopolophium dirhodum]
MEEDMLNVRKLENEFESLDLKMKPSTSKQTKKPLKRGTEKAIDKKNKKKQMKTSSSYREILEEKLRAEEFDEEILNSVTFRQGDGLATIKSQFNPDEKPTDYWTITYYKCANISNVPTKDRWRHSEASVKVTTSDKSKDQTLNNSLNETMQVIFDIILKDPERRTIRNKLAA